MMTLSELLLFDPEMKKKLFRFLKEKGLSYKVKGYRIEVHGIRLSDFGEVDVSYFRNGNIITYINVLIKRSGVDFADIKELGYELFGKPYMDNTNHITDNPEVSWQGGHLCAPDYDDTIYVIGASFDNWKSKPINHSALLSSLPIFGISMLGGIVWGILFFFFFGLGYGHTLLLFTLSMGGGIVFGLVMFLALEIIPRFEVNITSKRTNAKFKKRSEGILNKYRQDNFPNSSSSLAKVSYWVDGRYREYSAMVCVDDLGIHIAYLKGKELLTKTVAYPEIQALWGSKEYSWITIPCKNSQTVSISPQNESFDEIFAYIEEQLGYNDERTLAIEDCIFNCIVEYDPGSHIALGGDSTSFSENSKYLARMIVLMDNHDFESVNAVINSYLLDDDHVCVFDELNHNIYNSLVDKGLI